MDYKIDMIGGFCPVQAEGSVGDKKFYFRARGQQWSVGVGDDPVASPDWRYSERYGEDLFDAGWMTVAEARDFIDKAMKLYATGAPVPGSMMDDPLYSDGYLAAWGGGETVDNDAWRLGFADGEKMKKSQEEIMKILDDKCNEGSAL